MWRAGRTLNETERGIIARQTTRALAGQRRYGAVQLQRDRRDWLDELAQELYDAIFYIEAQKLKHK